MNAKYFVTLTALVLATGLSPPVAQAQAFQHVPTSLSQQINSAPPKPPVEGAPGDRTGAGTRAKQPSKKK
jgi:hypothetical protein